MTPYERLAQLGLASPVPNSIGNGVQAVREGNLRTRLHWPENLVKNEKPAFYQGFQQHQMAATV